MPRYLSTHNLYGISHSFCKASSNSKKWFKVIAVWLPTRSPCGFDTTIKYNCSKRQLFKSQKMSYRHAKSWMIHIVSRTHAFAVSFKENHAFTTFSVRSPVTRRVLTRVTITCKKLTRWARDLAKKHSPQIYPKHPLFSLIGYNTQIPEISTQNAVTCKQSK